MIEQAGETLPFRCEPVFDIAADIEHYPQFLPGWISAEIRHREADVCAVRQTVGVGPLQLQFDSQAVLERPHRILVTSADPVFLRYGLTWTIAALPAGCRLDVAADFELRSWALQRLLRRVLPAALEGAVRAFDARVNALVPASEKVTAP